MMLIRAGTSSFPGQDDETLVAKFYEQKSDVTWATHAVMNPRQQPRQFK
jgi:hypothetical protein